MRAHEIIGEIADAVVGEAADTGVAPSRPDDWKKRAEATRREQERHRKLTQRIRDTETKNYQQQRAAQERQFRADDRVRALKRERSSRPAN